MRIAFPYSEPHDAMYWQNVDCGLGVVFRLQSFLSVTSSTPVSSKCNPENVALTEMRRLERVEDEVSVVNQGPICRNGLERKRMK